MADGPSERSERPRLALKPRDEGAARKLELERLHSGKKVGRSRDRPDHLAGRTVAQSPPPMRAMHVIGSCGL
jgi:hypothetical protein